MSRTIKYGRMLISDSGYRRIRILSLGDNGTCQINMGNSSHLHKIKTPKLSFFLTYLSIRKYLLCNPPRPACH
jgi:hypothetical protein